MQRVQGRTGAFVSDCTSYRFVDSGSGSPVAIPHAHCAPVTNVSLTGKSDAINLNEPFDGGMRPELPTGSGDALAQADEPPLVA
jgi:hypothetical protein